MFGFAFPCGGLRRYTNCMAQLRTSLPASDSPNRASDSRNDSPDEPHELTADEVRFSITGQEIQELDDGRERFDIIGQPRALRALKLAIEIEGKGYNIFATGLAGTGKRTAIMRLLKDHRPRKPQIRDIAYVHNFKQPDRPKVLYF